MKKQLFAAGIAALVLTAFLAVPVTAEDQELTDQTQEGNTEVEAAIDETSGAVAYIVTIPDKIDFGTLVCPAADEDSFTQKEFEVNCVQMVGVSAIQVSVCNEGAAAGEMNQTFYLSNQTDTSCTFEPVYDLYAGDVLIDTSQIMPANGYTYAVFTAEGQSAAGSVRLNQRQLYAYINDIASIAGSYSGKMVFTIAAN